MSKSGKADFVSSAWPLCRGTAGVGQVFDLTSVTIETGDVSGLPEPFVARVNLGQVKDLTYLG